VKRYYHILFWVIISGILILFFGLHNGSYIYSFYFTSFFLPVVIITSLVFNRILIPRYLLKGEYFNFIVYTIYTIIISLNIEMVIVFVAFLLLSLYDKENMIYLVRNYRILPVIMYFIIILSGFINVTRHLIANLSLQSQGAGLKNDYLSVRANRRNMTIDHSDILYLESMSDYVIIFLVSGDKAITRESITNVFDKLPGQFIRIHRSYVINLAHLDSFTRESVTVKGKELPVSRTYKAAVHSVMAELDNSRG